MNRAEIEAAIPNPDNTMFLLRELVCQLADLNDSLGEVMVRISRVGYAIRVTERGEL